MQTISLDQFTALLKVGWKLCSQKDHYPLQDPLSKPANWRVCLAALPDRIGLKLENSSMLGASFGMSATVSIRENPPGHRMVYVDPTPEASEFLNAIQAKRPYDKPQTDPDLYLVPVVRAFIRLDVAKFSQFPVSLQPLVLAEIQEVADGVLKEDYQGAPQPEEIIHTGDGFIAVFPWQPPEDPHDDWLYAKAAQIASRLDRQNDNDERIPVHFRMSVTLGEVYLTRDLKGRPNFVGSAITETERLISCMPSNIDDLVYFSDKVYRELRGVAIGFFSRVGSVADKHGSYHRIYALEYSDYE